MSGGEQDDYSADIKFGEWLRLKRTSQGLSIEATAKLAELSVGRLKGLEMGLSGRGITSQEAKRLGSVYKIELKEIIVRASKS